MVRTQIISVLKYQESIPEMRPHMTRVKEEIISELNGLPPRTHEETSSFTRFLKSQRQKAFPDTALASEAVLRRDWLQPEEDEAWNDL